MKPSKSVGVISFHETCMPNRFFGRVELSKIEVDSSYQRGLCTQHKIDNHFTPASAMPLIVSMRGNQLYVVDGQQRLFRLRQHGYQVWDAIIVTESTSSSEAELFNHLNDFPKKVSGWDKFQSYLASGSLHHKNLWELFTKYDLTTPLNPGPHGPDISTSHVMVDALRRYGCQTMEKTLSVLKKAWYRSGKLLHGSTAIDLLRGLLPFIRDSKLSEQALGEILGQFTPEEIRAKAKNIPSKGRVGGFQFQQVFKEISFPQEKVVA